MTDRHELTIARGAAARRPAERQLVTIEDKIDESLEESFPASDPPNWIALARVGKPKRPFEDQ